MAELWTFNFQVRGCSVDRRPSGNLSTVRAFSRSMGHRVSAGPVPCGHLLADIDACSPRLSRPTARNPSGLRNIRAPWEHPCMRKLRCRLVHAVSAGAGSAPLLDPSSRVRLDLGWLWSPGENTTWSSHPATIGHALPASIASWASVLRDGWVFIGVEKGCAAGGKCLRGHFAPPPGFVRQIGALARRRHRATRSRPSSRRYAPSSSPAPTTPCVRWVDHCPNG